MKFIAITSMFMSVTVATNTYFNCNNNSPCDPLAEDGVYYYPHRKDYKFIQCSDFGQCFTLRCPEGLVWDEDEESCVMARRLEDSGCFDCENVNPCSPLATAGVYYYPHCFRDRFVQCSGQGECYAKYCPQNLWWNPDVLACSVTPHGSP